MRFLNWLRSLFLPTIQVPIPSPVPTPVPASVPVPSIAGLLKSHNDFRADYKLDPLAPNQPLQDVAQYWATMMASNRVLDHGDFKNRIRSFTPISLRSAENIAEGQQTVEQVMACWKNSHEHRANMLGPYNRVGFGIAPDNNGTLYFCTVFSYVPSS